MVKIGMAVLAALLLGGCGQLPEQETAAEMIVFLDADITDTDRTDVLAYLEALPGVENVDPETHEEAFKKYQELFSDAPELAGVDAESLPESFRVRADSLDAYQALRDGSAKDTLEAMHGVDEVVFQCATVAECATTRPLPAAPS